MSNIQPIKTQRDQFNLQKNANQIRSEYVGKIKQALGENSEGKKIDISLSYITTEKNIRDFEKENPSFLALKKSLNEDGLIQPISASIIGDQIVLVAGHRRLSAAKELGWKKISVYFKQKSDDKEKLQFIENVLREDLTPIETCEGLHALEKSYGYTKIQLASIYGKSRNFTSALIKAGKEWSDSEKKYASENKVSLTNIYKIAEKSEANILEELTKCAITQSLDGRVKKNKDSKVDRDTKKRVRVKWSDFNITSKEKFDAEFDQSNLDSKTIKKIQNMVIEFSGKSDSEKNLLKKIYALLIGHG